MNWYLMRHGDAAPAGGIGPGDDQRPLSAAGRAEVQRCAQGLRRLGVEVDRILTSPLVRAQETGTVLAEGVGGVPVEQHEALRPGVPTDQLVASLEVYRQQRVLLIGHQPDLGLLMSRVVWGGGAADVTFRKAAVCCLNVSWGPGRMVAALDWFLTPDQLGQIGPPQK